MRGDKMQRGRGLQACVSLFLPDEGQELCQETCAMSLTRVWMSCRHRGHVSNCKAHSIHIPLQSRREGKEKTTEEQTRGFIHAEGNL